MVALTKSQRDVLDFIEGQIASENRPPTIREIQAFMGFKSPQAVSHITGKLIAAGLLENRGSSRGLVPVRKDDAAPPDLIQARRKSSHLERRFALLWRARGGSELRSEVVFHPSRKWRFDFALTGDRKIAFEMEGGIWTRGRHGRGKGMTEDCEKYLEAALLGWTVIRLVDSQIKAPVIERLIRFVKERK